MGLEKCGGSLGVVGWMPRNIQKKILVQQVTLPYFLVKFSESKFLIKFLKSQKFHTVEYFKSFKLE